METPPGTIKIGENLYADKNEITNFNWAEYLYWIKRNYPDDYELYKRNLPDTNAWGRGGDYCLNDWSLHYLRHPSLRNYPAVGINCQQALGFSQWRSDRVMEYILIREGLIKWNNSTNPDSVFTIKKYFTGNYNGYIPNDKIKYYPEYSLPDSITWILIQKFSDSVYIKKKNKISRKKCEIYTTGHHIHINPCIVEIPTAPAYCKKCGSDMITHLHGNVRELSVYENISFSEGWKDSLYTGDGIPKYYADSAGQTNSYTGFRNICSWKEWKHE